MQNYGGLEVKVTAIFILILVSLNIFSEEYICSSELSQIGRDGEVEIITYERSGDIFIQTSHLSVNYLQILEETEEFILLVRTFSYPSIRIIFLNKKKQEVVDEFLSFDNVTSSKPLVGKCLIKY